MDPFEHDLSRRLARREPPAGLAARVMDEVRKEPGRVLEMPTRRRPWRWASAGALAASLVMGFYLHGVEKRRRAEAEIAEAQLVDTLLVAGAKISQAREKVLGIDAAFAGQGVIEP